MPSRVSAAAVLHVAALEVGRCDVGWIEQSQQLQARTAMGADINGRRCTQNGRSNTTVLSPMKIGMGVGVDNKLRQLLLAVINLLHGGHIGLRDKTRGG